MTPETFMAKYYRYALEAQRETTIPALAYMARGAHESGWGKKSIGNNIFGVKYRKGDWGYQKVLTTEYSESANDFKDQEIKSIKYDAEKKMYKYMLWQYFADYPTPKDAFVEHSKLLLTKRYKPALRWNYSPLRYLIATWRLGYATDPDYGNHMCKVVKSTGKRIPKLDELPIRELIKIKEIQSIPAGRIAGEIPKKLKLTISEKN